MTYLGITHINKKFVFLLILSLFFLSCIKDKNKITQMLDNHYWEFCTKVWVYNDDTVNINNERILYYFSNQNILTRYNFNDTTNNYTLILPDKNWQIVSNNTLKIGNRLYEYFIINDTTFVLNIYQTNTIYDTLKRVDFKVKPSFLIKDTIVIHDLDTVLKI